MVADSTHLCNIIVGSGACFLLQVNVRGHREETASQEQEEVDIWGRGRAGRIPRCTANARTGSVCTRGGLVDHWPRGLRYIVRLDAQAATGRGMTTSRENMTGKYMRLSYPY